MNKVRIKLKLANATISIKELWVYLKCRTYLWAIAVVSATGFTCLMLSENWLLFLDGCLTLLSWCGLRGIHHLLYILAAGN